MDSAVVTILAGLSAISSALIAGTFFAFSTIVMRSLGSLAPAHGAAAMQIINAIILRSLFMPVFMGASALSPLLAGWALVHRGQPGSTLLLAAGLVHSIGVFGCTVAFNVPLNNMLARVDAASGPAASVWVDYLNRWTGWNHVRTIAATTACALFAGAVAVNWPDRRSAYCESDGVRVAQCLGPGADPSSSTDAISSGFPQPRRH